MKKLFAASLLLCVSCAEPIYRETAAVRRIDADVSENRATIRTLSSDATVFILSKEDFSRLSLADNDDESNDSLLCFALVIKNMTDFPLSIPAVSVLKGKSRSEEKENSTALNITPSGRMLRILNETGGMDDLETDTVNYSMNFILPRDSIALFYRTATPATSKFFHIRVTTYTARREKIIDFDYTRREYRQTEGER